MANKKRIKELHQTHGRVDESNFQTLDQLFGNTGIGEYGTLDVQEYESQLKEMATHDLHEHSVKKGVLPVDNRERLIKTLLAEFQKHVMRFKAPTNRTPKTKAPDAKMVAIMAEGR